ncbi:MAG TPA: leucyl/phenylalanyl-tRNA--protein transferase [Xanthomonadaceae bacterium]|nr:leucyl/phenylalanyl-tRNA--protein transferase [Xanthomonadaceae bacterium]
MASGRPALLSPDPSAPFPPATAALDSPEGLLAIGGDLSPVRLLNAYRHGIFPWSSAGQPLLWWSPDPRMVFRTDGVHLSRRFRRGLARSGWVVQADHAFEAVVARCGRASRPGQDGTWITPDMEQAYAALHALGHAHSIEVVDGDRLAGGLYGVAIGRMFFAESMFSDNTGGSKVALAALARWLASRGWPLVDAQLDTPHLRSLGGEAWPRAAFLSAIAPLVDHACPAGDWRDSFGRIPAGSLA